MPQGMESEIAAALRHAGHRRTPQRLRVAMIVRSAPGHITAAEVLQALSPADVTIDASTVYRTLALLHSLGLVTQTSTSNGEMVFEWQREERHHHLRCETCGGIETVAPDVLDPLTRWLREHLTLPGACRACASTAP
jgi:Fe2+ or Zn2+ uptake regulation protein